MTNRINSVTLILDHDIREDEIEPLLSALGMFRYVIRVTPNVANVDTHSAYVRVRHEIERKLFEVLKD